MLVPSPRFSFFYFEEEGTEFGDTVDLRGFKGAGFCGRWDGFCESVDWQQRIRGTREIGEGGGATTWIDKKIVERQRRSKRGRFDRTGLWKLLVRVRYRTG